MLDNLIYNKNIFISLLDSCNNEIIINDKNCNNFFIYYELKIEEFMYNNSKSLKNNYNKYYEYYDCELNINLLDILYYMQINEIDKIMKINDFSLNLFFEDYCQDILEEYIVYNLNQYELESEFFCTEEQSYCKRCKTLNKWTIRKKI